MKCIKKSAFKIYFYLPIFIFLLLNNLLFAQPELTGFFDVIHTQDLIKNNFSKFQINQFELDISYAHQSHFSLGTAVSFNNETQNMELAIAYAHYNFFDDIGMHPRREEKMNHTGIVAGKFDINFGLDYLSFASPDRPVVSSPLVYEKTIGNWNDVGIEFHIVHGALQFHLWSVNGFYEGIDFGGSIRYSIFPFLSIGASYMNDFEKIDKIKANLKGLDFLIGTEDIEIKSEYLLAKGIFMEEKDTLGSKNHGGYYIQALTQLNKLLTVPLFFTIRYGKWNSEVDRDLNGINDYETRITLGLGYHLHKNVSARFELLKNDVEGKKEFFESTLQLVVTF
jgi:hypothetical protein